MHGNYLVAATPATKATDKSVSKIADISADTDNFCNDWFPRLANDLLAKDAGFQLHLITGFEERTCYRYACGESKPPAYFLRALLRSSHGKQFLLALMAGCDQQWWSNFQRHRRMGEAADNAK